MSESAAARARLRIQEELKRRGMSQADVAGILKWNESRVSKLLNGKISMDVDDLAALCFAVNLSIVEAVRDHGMEFCAEMTPTELRIIQRLREADKPYYEAILTILHVRPSLTPERFATSPMQHHRGGKPRLR